MERKTITTAGIEYLQSLSNDDLMCLFRAAENSDEVIIYLNTMGRVRAEYGWNGFVHGSAA